MAKETKLIATVHYQSLDEIKPSNIPTPAPPKNAKQPFYLVRITHTSPTHVDTLYARGLHQNNNPKRGLVHPPFTLGNEFSGIVIRAYPCSATSSKTPRFKAGDRVWGTWLGAFATRVVAPETSLHPIPDRLGLRDAAALGASTVPVSYGALLQVARLKKGETCLVHAAAGGLGVVAVQIARALGANVIGTVGSDHKGRVVEEMIRNGAEMPKGCGVVRYDLPDWEEKVKGMSNSGGVDAVFDSVGLIEKSIRCCNFNARVVIIGFVGRGGKMEKIAANRILLKGIQLLGYRYGETGRRMPRRTIETWDGVNAILDRGEVKPVIYREFSGLGQIPEALRLMTTRDVAGKIVVEVEDEDEDEDEEGKIDLKSTREAKSKL